MSFRSTYIRPYFIASVLTLSLCSSVFVETAAAAEQEPNPVAVAAQPLTALDKLSIIELAARFEMSLDREDVQGYLATFAPDGTLEGFGPPARGEKALRAAFFNMLNAFARNRRHCSMNQIITGDDQTATMVSYLVVFNRNDLGRGGSAVVTDKAVKLNGQWFLLSRKIEVDPSFKSTAAQNKTQRVK